MSFTPEQAAAYINSQVTCAQAEMLAMQAENREREMQGHTHAFDAAAFRAVPEDFGIGYNSVVSFIQEANS